MKLDELVGGSIYIDTNVLYMYLRVDPIYLPSVRKFFERVVHGNLEAFVGIPVMDELFYRLLLSRIKESSGRNPLDVLREDLTKTITIHGPAIEAPLRKLAALPHLNLVGLERMDFYRMLENINRFSLLPRDALHLAIIQRLEIPGIATDDLDFDRVETIDRHWIINPPAR